MISFKMAQKMQAVNEECQKPQDTQDYELRSANAVAGFHMTSQKFELQNY